MKRWSVDEIECLRQEWGVPPDIDRISSLLRRSPMAIYHKAKSLSLPRQPAHVSRMQRNGRATALEGFLPAFAKLRIEKAALAEVGLGYRTLHRERQRNPDFAQRYDKVKDYLSETVACSTCGHVGNYSDFYVKDERRVWGTCRGCEHKSQKKHRRTLRGKLFMLARCARSRKEGSTLTGAEMLNLWELQQGRCFYTNRSMSIHDPKGWDGVSVDRKDPEKPYTKANCVLTTKLVNTMKSKCTVQEFYQICREVVALL